GSCRRSRSPRAATSSTYQPTRSRSNESRSVFGNARSTMSGPCSPIVGIRMGLPLLSVEGGEALAADGPEAAPADGEAVEADLLAAEAVADVGPGLGLGVASEEDFAGGGVEVVAEQSDVPEVLVATGDLLDAPLLAVGLDEGAAVADGDDPVLSQAA